MTGMIWGLLGALAFLGICVIAAIGQTNAVDSDDARYWEP